MIYIPFVIFYFRGIIALQDGLGASKSIVSSVRPLTSFLNIFPPNPFSGSFLIHLGFFKSCVTSLIVLS